MVSIVGTDEIDLKRNHISWVSPLGRALRKSAAGDSVVLQLLGGREYLSVLEVRYDKGRATQVLVVSLSDQKSWTTRRARLSAAQPPSLSGRSAHSSAAPGAKPGSMRFLCIR